MPHERLPPRGKPPARWLLLAASSLLSLLVGEMLVRRLAADEVDAERIAARQARTHFGAFTRPSRIPGLVYELAPGTRLRWSELPLLVISDRGPYRIPEAGERAVPAGALRLAVLGDSTSFGWRMSFDSSYPEVWRRSLEDQLGRPVALRNFSVPGYNSEQERLVLERWVAPWRPHLILLHYDHNDWEPALREKPASYLDPAYGDNPFHSALLKLTARRWRIAREVQRRRRLSAGEHPLQDGYAYAGPLYERHLEQLRRLGQLGSTGRMPVVCLVFDAFLRRAAEPLETEHYRRLHGDLVPALVAAGFSVLELYHPYQRLMAEQGWPDLSALWIEPTDAHPNELGHELIAQALTQHVRSRDSLWARLEEGP